MTYKPHPTVIEGIDDKVQTRDENARSLLARMLKELKKINLHLSLMTDEEIDNKEID